MPYIAYIPAPAAPTVVLLLHFDGDFADSSSFARTVTDNGGIGRTSGTVKFGSEAVTFDGSNDYLSVADSDDFPAGKSEPWSVDFWVYIPSSADMTADRCFVSQWKTGSLGWYIGCQSSKLRFYYSLDGSTPSFNIASDADLPRDEWVHIAVWAHRDTPTTLKINSAVNGEVQVFQIGLGTDVIFNATALLTVGAHDGPSAFMQSGVVVDELRICKTTIDYAESDFTPPTSAYS